MKKIIEQGFDGTYIRTCPVCGCVFEYTIYEIYFVNTDINDISTSIYMKTGNGNEYIGEVISRPTVDCPECGAGIIHAHIDEFIKKKHEEDIRVAVEFLKTLPKNEDLCIAAQEDKDVDIKDLNNKVNENIQERMQCTNGASGPKGPSDRKLEEDQIECINCGRVTHIKDASIKVDMIPESNKFMSYAKCQCGSMIPVKHEIVCKTCKHCFSFDEAPYKRQVYDVMSCEYLMQIECPECHELMRIKSI